MYVANPTSTSKSLFGGNAKKIDVVGDFDVKQVSNVRRATMRLSGREISKLGIAWQASAYGSAKGDVEEMMDVVFEIALAQHSQRLTGDRFWRSPQGNLLGK